MSVIRIHMKEYALSKTACRPDVLDTVNVHDKLERSQANYTNS